MSELSAAIISFFLFQGGLELALLCDLRVVEESATFGVFCRRFGVPLIDGGTVRLQRIVGLGRALDLTLTGSTENVLLHSSLLQTVDELMIR
jgi:enoyl-CoA hydratase